MEEWNDIYDAQRRRTGRRHLRGTAWGPGEYGLVVCVWVYDGRGKLLLTRRASEKSFAGTWENTGGAAQAGEDSLPFSGSCGRRPALPPRRIGSNFWAASAAAIHFTTFIA